MKRRFFLFFSLLAAVSCASVNVAKEKTYPTPAKGQAMVYFYRESMFQGSATSYNIWYDEAAPKKIGSLKNGSYFHTQLPPGKYTFFVNGEVRSAVSFEMKANKTYFVNMNINMGFWAARPKLTPVAEEGALERIKGTDLVMTELSPE